MYIDIVIEIDRGHAETGNLILREKERDRETNTLTHTRTHTHFQKRQRTFMSVNVFFVFDSVYMFHVVVGVCFLAWR